MAMIGGLVPSIRSFPPPIPHADEREISALGSSTFVSARRFKGEAKFSGVSEDEIAGGSSIKGPKNREASCNCNWHRKKSVLISLSFCNRSIFDDLAAIVGETKRTLTNVHRQMKPGGHKQVNIGITVRFELWTGVFI